MGSKYLFVVDEEVAYAGDLQTKQWVSLRIFAGSKTEVQFDDLIIKAIK